MFRKVLPPIHFHPVLILFTILSFFTGTFLQLSVILFIVFIHEMGHYVVAKMYKWRIRKIMLWVFGGVMETDEEGTRSIKEEFLVTIAGPLQHILLYFLFVLLNWTGFMSEVVFEMAILYNTTILLFNLLPIWPLDGGKIMFLLFALKLPYQKSFFLSLKISVIVSLLLLFGHIFIYSFTLSFAAIMIFLILENRTEWRRRYFLLTRFLLNRYKGRHAILKRDVIYLSNEANLMEAFKKFKRDKRHTIFVQRGNQVLKKVDESECLHAYFYEKQHSKKIIDI